ncbi:hypothetical protein GUJ93_ZPchr0003g16814 [Zizania palustris]|uniref:DUF4057 domain-containing protein n=2 Tax=Zizania palustris TaxID=103762 RepID=A0A8J5SCF8_ZIZPA|nr:hypothetical protein GUJ93_ZPchr0003g16814 [Zizania palustris]
MERAAPVRKSHTSTADLLAWPQQGDGLEATPSPLRRPHQPSEALRKVVFGGQVTEEEAESLNKRKPCSAPKWKEMTGSGIFTAGANGEAEESGTAATPGRAPAPNYQAVSTVSHISFAEDGSVPPKKATSVAEVAKQRELSGTLQSEADSKMKRQVSNAKSKELSGHGLFDDPQDARPNGARNKANGSAASHTPVKNANVSSFSFGYANTDSVARATKKITGKKFTDLTGNNIFKGNEAPVSAEKHLSTAKLKEMSGSNIFAEGQAPTREYHSGNRKPPGGESTIALI